MVARTMPTLNRRQVPAFGPRVRAATLGLVLSLAGLPASEVLADRAMGEYLSAECVTCHQLAGQYDGIPPIVGWPIESFIHIMNEYRDKTRDNAIMQTIAGRFSPEEIAALAEYFGSLPVRIPKN
jgi:cytochrome c553